MIVLQSTADVMRQASHVRINPQAIRRWARETPDVNPAAKFKRDLFADLPGDRDAIANLILLISSLNFCFWSDEPIEITFRGQTHRGFSAMLISLILAAKHDKNWTKAEHWVSAPLDEIEQVVQGRFRLPLMDRRIQIIRETGQTLIDRFDGKFTSALESVNERAWPLAVLLMTNFDSFRDVGAYGTTPVYFLKRAQICALDLSLAFLSTGRSVLNGLEDLTAFADYRIPQALRHLGILELDESLEHRIEADEEIPKDSPEEVELRAATIRAVDLMTSEYKSAGRRGDAWEIDESLWQLARSDEVTVRHHRTRTVFY